MSSTAQSYSSVSSTSCAFCGGQRLFKQAKAQWVSCCNLTRRFSWEVDDSLAEQDTTTIVVAMRIRRQGQDQAMNLSGCNTHWQTLLTFLATQIHYSATHIAKQHSKGSPSPRDGQLNEPICTIIGRMTRNGEFDSGPKETQRTYVVLIIVWINFKEQTAVHLLDVKLYRDNMLRSAYLDAYID